MSESVRAPGQSVWRERAVRLLRGVLIVGVLAVGAAIIF